MTARGQIGIFERRISPATSRIEDECLELWVRYHDSFDAQSGMLLEMPKPMKPEHESP
jgi:hypothetical protein